MYLITVSLHGNIFIYLFDALIYVVTFQNTSVESADGVFSGIYFTSICFWWKNLEHNYITFHQMQPDIINWMLLTTIVHSALSKAV